MLTITLITPVSDDVIATIHNNDAELAAKFVDLYITHHDLTDDVDVTMTDSANDDVYDYDFTIKSWSAR